MCSGLRALRPVQNAASRIRSKMRRVVTIGLVGEIVPDVSRNGASSVSKRNNPPNAAGQGSRRESVRATRFRIGVLRTESEGAGPCAAYWRRIRSMTRCVGADCRGKSPCRGMCCMPLSPCLPRRSLRGGLPPFRTVRPSSDGPALHRRPVGGRTGRRRRVPVPGRLSTGDPVRALLRFALPESNVVPFPAAARQTVRASSESVPMNPFVLSATRRGATSRFRASRGPARLSRSKPLRQSVS